MKFSNLTQPILVKQAKQGSNKKLVCYTRNKAGDFVPLHFGDAWIGKTLKFHRLPKINRQSLKEKGWTTFSTSAVFTYLD